MACNVVGVVMVRYMSDAGRRENLVHFHVLVVSIYHIYAYKTTGKIFTVLLGIITVC